MNTIIRLSILAMIMAMTFAVNAQENVNRDSIRAARQDSIKNAMIQTIRDTSTTRVVWIDSVSYRIYNPEWFKHLLGKTIKEVNAIPFEKDSIKWIYGEHTAHARRDYYLGVDFPARFTNVYTIKRGDKLLECRLMYVVCEDGSMLLYKITIENQLCDSVIDKLRGYSLDREDMLRARQDITPRPQKTLQRAFWEAKFKEDDEKRRRNNK